MAVVYLLLPLKEKQPEVSEYHIRVIARDLRLDLREWIDECDVVCPTIQYRRQSRDRVIYSLDQLENGVKGYLNACQSGIDKCDWVAYLAHNEYQRYKMNAQMNYEDAYARLIGKPVRYFYYDDGIYREESL